MPTYPAHGWTGELNAVSDGRRTTVNKGISLAAYTPTELKTLRTRLEAQRRRELASAKGIDRVLNLVSEKLDRFESRRLAA